MQQNDFAVCGLGHIGVFISDIAVSCAFYQKLGFEIAAQYHRPNGVILTFVKAGSCILELIRPVDPTLIGRPAGVVDHICLSVQNIEACTAALRASGVLPDDVQISTLPDVLGGAKNVFFRGPDGERLELFECPETL